MTSPAPELVADFGHLGYRPNALHPFRVRLTCTPLLELIADARNAFRTYELLLITRPGDVWRYVAVTSEALPPQLQTRIAAAQCQQAISATADYGKMPFLDFDALFFSTG